jgi:hypothetical protein
MSKLEYSKKYYDNKLISFTFNLKQNKYGKKEFQNIPQFSKINNKNYTLYINETHNAMALKMGEYDKKYYIILIDIDNKEDDKDLLNGMTKWKELKKNHKITTAIQKTGNDGLHYLFKIKHDDIEKLPKAITGLRIDGKKYSIDYKGENQIMIVEPTKYGKKEYKWKKYPLASNIQVIPEWLLNLLLKHNTQEEEKEDIVIQNTVNQELVIHNKNNIKQESNKINLEKYVFMLNKERSENYDTWINLGILLYNLGVDNLDIWKKFSKFSKKYDEKVCDDKWHTFKNKDNKLNFGTLIYWLRIDNPYYVKDMRTIKNTQNIIDKYKNICKKINIILDTTKKTTKKDIYQEILLKF